MLLLGDAESLLQPATGEQSAGYYSKMPRSRLCQKLRLTSIKIGEMSVIKLPILIVLIKSMSRQIETPCLNFFKKNFSQNVLVLLYKNNKTFPFSSWILGSIKKGSHACSRKQEREN